MTTAELADFQHSLRALLPDPDAGVFAVLDALKKKLPGQTEKHNTVFLLATRLNTLTKDRMRGLLSQDDLDLAYNRITADVLDLINGLLPEDFDLHTAANHADNKSGSILYRIPHTMEVEEEYKCVVRLAFDEDTVIKNIQITKDTVVKDVRVSEVMEVELLDPNATPSFAIRRFNSAEQFLEKNDYTEWIFFVKPLLTGTLPLMLKVSVKELIDNKERIKEIVLEEVITVVAEPASGGDTATFQNAGYAFSYSTPSAPAASGPSKQRPAMLLVLGIVAASGLFAAVGVMTGVLPNPFGPPNKKTNPATEQPAGEGRTGTVDSLANPGTPPEDSVTLSLPDTLPAETTPTKSGGAEKAAQQKDRKKATPDAPQPDQPGKKRKSGFEMVPVPSGNLAVKKGDCPDGASLRIRPFKIGKYEVTQADWRAVMGNSPAFNGNCAECPVERVSWDDAQAFAQKASQKNGKRYRLPYEAEWEFAARGGPQSKGFRYAGSNNRPNEVARFNEVQGKTGEVGGGGGNRRPNELGIFDMSGNVWEWCLAPYPPYAKCKASDSERKIQRGGSWADNRRAVQITSRRTEKASSKDDRTGLRLVEE